jgi:hypothetical protein
MSDDREFWRATSDWLEAGSDRTPPAAVDAVLLAVRTTRQDRPLPLPGLPFRLPLVARVALVATALVAFALLAFNLVLVVGQHRPPTDTVPVSTPIPLMVSSGDTGTPFKAGTRYTTADPFPIRITFSGPAGWEGNIGGPYAVWLGPPVGDQPVMFNTSVYPYLDPCRSDTRTVGPPPATVAGVVDALDALPGVDVTDRAATIGGRAATLLTATAPGSLAGCANGAYRLWELPLGTVVTLPPGATLRIWVVDVGAQWPLVIGAEDHAAWPPQLRAATEQLLDSLQIKPSS